MISRKSLPVLVVLAALTYLSVPASAQQAMVKAGEFDNGKMWTFDYPPIEQFKKDYNFEPDAAWFEKARLGALRLPNCSASFVSPNGLVMTNHHCGRGPVANVAREGERLLDEGFTSATLEEERQAPGLYVDQLIDIQDVTDEVFAALRDQQTDAEIASARQEVIQAITERLTAAAGGDDAGVVVQVINLYNGGRYSAYTFRRFNDVRLVMTPELSVGYYGGDADNFTYPRYALDMTFFRVYEDGEPYQPEHYFKWSENGSAPGDAIFVIGNPGSTLRLETVEQLEYRRDVNEKSILAFVESRIKALEAYHEENPSDALRNQIFGLKNTEKLYKGRVKGLNDPILMAKRADTERQFLEDLDLLLQETITPDLRASMPFLSQTLIDDIAAIQQQKREYAAGFGGFLAMQPQNGLASVTLRRALVAHAYLTQQAAGGDVEALKQQLLGIGDQDAGLNAGFMKARIKDLATYYGKDHPTVETAVAGRSVDEIVEDLASNSALTSAEAVAAAVGDGSLSLDDPAIAFVSPFMDNLQETRSALAGLGAQEVNLNEQHGRARFEVYGTTRPPDATFSVRIADGVVSGYEYNGTVAPAFTTFFGMYDRFASYGAGTEWDLPERWQNAPSTFDLSTPVNMVTTADIIGGNSGSPVLNKNLEVVGLIFDGNVESLPSAYIYNTDTGRSVAVDSRGMIEALDDIYDMDRIVIELKSGQLIESESDADAIIGSR